MTGKIELFFSSGTEIALDRVRFSHSMLDSAHLSIRGKFSGAYGGEYTFQWSPAVRALTILLLRTKLPVASADGAILKGGANTPASSLDYAIGKLPCWLLDLFGTDSHGQALVRRIVRRTNPERKRGGESALSINPNQLPSEQIHASLDGKPVASNSELRRLLSSIEGAWVGGRRVLLPARPLEAKTSRREVDEGTGGTTSVLIFEVQQKCPQSQRAALRFTARIFETLLLNSRAQPLAANAFFSEQELHNAPILLADRLGCAYVLTGTCIQSKGRVDLTVQLVEAASSRTCWLHSQSGSPAAIEKMGARLNGELRDALANLDKAKPQMNAKPWKAAA